MEEVLDLLCRYSTRRMFIDENFIDELINNFIVEKKLGSYVLYNAPGKPDKTELLGNYDFDQYFVEIYLKNLKEDVELAFDGILLSDRLSIFEQYFYKNVIALETVFHELGHANQNKIRYIGRHGLKTDIIKIGIDLFKTKNKKLIDSSYYVSPLERMAETYSYEQLTTFLEPILKEIKGLKNFIECKALEARLKAYDKRLVSPTEKFFEILGEYELWQGFDFYSPDRERTLKNTKKLYSLEERLIMGLPIEQKEYCRLRELRNKKQQFL